MKSVQPLILEEYFKKDPSLNLFPFLVIHPRSENPWIRIFLWLLPPSLTDYNLLWPRLLCPRKVSLRYKSGSLPQHVQILPSSFMKCFLIWPDPYFQAPSTLHNWTSCEDAFPVTPFPEKISESQWQINCADTAQVTTIERAESCPSYPSASPSHCQPLAPCDNHKYTAWVVGYAVPRAPHAQSIITKLHGFTSLIMQTPWEQD